jgi:hypothetical protein
MMRWPMRPDCPKCNMAMIVTGGFAIAGRTLDFASGRPVRPDACYRKAFGSQLVSYVAIARGLLLSKGDVPWLSSGDF